MTEIYPGKPESDTKFLVLEGVLVDLTGVEVCVGLVEV